MTDQPTTVVELPATMRDLMRRQLNKGVMVAWINADLLNRCNNDVRTSIVLYDEAGVFEFAVANMPNENLLQRLYDGTNVRYWSKGI
jgi:hypothetical protein